jgi:hypothetical protein
MKTEIILSPCPLGRRSLYDRRNDETSLDEVEKIFDLGPLWRSNKYRTART